MRRFAMNAEAGDIALAALTVLQVLLRSMVEKGLISQAERDALVDDAIRIMEDASRPEMIAANERTALLLRAVFERP